MKEIIVGAAAGFIIVSAVYNVIGSGAAGIAIAALAGLAIGGLVYYVLGFDTGYAKGRKDERHDHWRHNKNEP